MKRAILVMGLLAALASILAAVSVQAQSQPVLVNPGFEGEFTVRYGAGEVRVGKGWDPAFLEGDDRECRAPCFRPEFTPEETIVAGGKYSQRWFTTFARQFAAIHQEVSVQGGEWYEFSCDVYVISEPDGQMAAFVGANPWGGDVFRREMIWGPQQPWGSNREWNRVAVTFQALGGKARVALGANNAYATKNNAVYWDNCAMRHLTIEAAPTPAPYPTYTPYPTPPACPTCVPGTGGCDVGAIRDAVGTVVAEREPVRWPR